MHRASVSTDVRTLPAGAQRFMLALTGRLLKPRVVPGGPVNERWARAWARRWWVVAAANADQARAAIARYEEKLAGTPLSEHLDASTYGILEVGKNVGGLSGEPPWSEPSDVRPSPSAAMRRRANARGPTAQGANHR